LSETTIQLPSGNTAVFRDPLSVTNGERKLAVKALGAKGLDEDDLEEQVSAIEKIIILMVKEWSFPFPVPTANSESLDAIPAMDHDKLVMCAMDRDLIPFLDTDINPDPKAPTGSSKSSNGASPEETLTSEMASRSSSAPTT